MYRKPERNPESSHEGRDPTGLKEESYFGLGSTRGVALPFFAVFCEEVLGLEAHGFGSDVCIYIHTNIDIHISIYIYTYTYTYMCIVYMYVCVSIRTHWTCLRAGGFLV